jgi:ATP-dependent DNA helicase
VDSFKSWFDIDVTAESSASQQIISKLHAILKPFLLRRVKRDVEKSLPPKKEYLLSAPLTQEQKKLYDAVLKRQIRDFLLAKKEIVPDSEIPNFTTDEEPETAGDSEDDDEVAKVAKASAAKGKASASKKRTAEQAKLGSGSSATKRGRPSYKDVDEEDFLQSLDDGTAHAEAARFEKERYGNNIAMEGFGKITGKESSDEDEDDEEKRANKIAKTATKKINRLKLSNMVMQLRKVVNHVCPRPSLKKQAVRLTICK